VTGLDDWPPATALQSERLILEPLRLEHADEMAPLLDDPRLHEFTGGEPRSLTELRAAYRRRIGAGTVDGQRWCNWVVRCRASGRAVGCMQATITREPERFVAEVAWVVGCEHQGRGHAREAAGQVAAWLREQGAHALIADIHARNEPSMAVARSLGLAPTGEVPRDEREVRWRG
jgi:RimJ/RimL family protein N-acetyltransferase